MNVGEHRNENPEKLEEQEGQVKKTYTEPSLKKLGKVDKLTQGGGMSGIPDAITFSD